MHLLFLILSKVMTIPVAMLQKAESLIAADSLDAYRRANPRHNPHGKHRAKPYRLSQRSQDLATAIGSGDPEQVAAIMLYRFHATFSTL